VTIAPGESMSALDSATERPSYRAASTIAPASFLRVKTLDV
jgi:hypothetical protein